MACHHNFDNITFSINVPTIYFGSTVTGGSLLKWLNLSVRKNADKLLFLIQWNHINLINVLNVTESS
jgi:hypothetical protein